MTPSNNRNELEYLKALVILMMKADGRRGTVDTGPLKLTGLLRVVPTLNVQATNAKALQLRKDLARRRGMCIGNTSRRSVAAVSNG